MSASINTVFSGNNLHGNAVFTEHTIRLFTSAVRVGFSIALDADEQGVTLLRLQKQIKEVSRVVLSPKIEVEIPQESLRDCNELYYFIESQLEQLGFTHFDKAAPVLTELQIPDLITAGMYLTKLLQEIEIGSFAISSNLKDESIAIRIGKTHISIKDPIQLPQAICYASESLIEVQERKENDDEISD